MVDSADPILREHARQNLIAAAAIAVGVATAIAGAFWTQVNPRAELDQIKKDYLTTAVHIAFETRVQNDFNRLNDDIKRLDTDHLSVAAFDAWKVEREGRVREIEKQLHDHVSEAEFAQFTRADTERIHRIENFLNDVAKIHEQFVSRSELDRTIAGLQHQIDDLKAKK